MRTLLQKYFQHIMDHNENCAISNFGTQKVCKYVFASTSDNLFFLTHFCEYSKLNNNIEIGK